MDSVLQKAREESHPHIFSRRGCSAVRGGRNPIGQSERCSHTTTSKDLRFIDD